MLNRSFFFAVSVWLATSVAAFGQASGNAYLFQIPAVNSGSSQILGFLSNTNNLNSPTINAQGPTGTFQIIAKPDGTKFYLLGTNSVQEVDAATFSNFQPINGITGTPTAGAISPDGTRLVVAAGNPANIYIIDTNSNTIVGTPGTVSGGVVQQYGIAITQDSTRAFVLSNPAFGSSLTAFDLTTSQRINAAPLSLGGDARGVTLSPLGLLYVSVGNNIYEVDPSTVNLTANGVGGNGTVGVVADPGPVRFTPDGTTGYFINHNPSIGGASIFKLTLATLTATSWPPFNASVAPPVFDDVYVAGNSRIFAYSSASTSLYDITPTPLSGALSALSNVVSVTNVVAIALSTELPASSSLFLLVTSGQQVTLERINLTTNTVSLTSSSSVGVVPLEYLAVPSASGAASFIQYNNPQTLTAGATSLPLEALVLDGNGNRVFNLPVTFSAPSTSGVVINTPSPTTNANGYVQTTVTVPGGTQGGNYTITLTAGTASTTFTLNVPGSGGGGGVVGGGGGGISQVTIVSGDGQLIYGDFSEPQPMTIKVTDTSGNPLAGVPVSFGVTSGNATVGAGSTSTTDVNGLAECFFTASFVSIGQAYLPSTITATTTYGSVTFTETAVPSENSINFQQAVQPEIDLDAPGPNTGYGITIGAGQVLPGAVVARIYAAASPELGAPPIPNVGVSIVNSQFDLTLSPAAYCQGDPLSDQTGRVSCNLVGSCLAPGTVTPVAYEVGDITGFSGSITTVQGSASQLQKLSGDGQNGRAGQQLQTALLAVVTDGCGTPVAGATVTWQVIQGTAVLTGATDTSDSRGRVTTQLTFGQTPGTIQVQVTLPGITQAVFTLTNQVVVSNVNVVSGNNQTALENIAFAQPLVVSVLDNNGNPVPSVTVTFSVASGSAAIQTPGPTTNTQGQASTTVLAGATPGPVTITATFGSFSATFTLTVQPPGPSIGTGSFLSAAFSPTSSGVSGLVPCGLSTVTGMGLAPSLQGVVSGVSAFGPLPYTLAGVAITVGSIPAPIQVVANQGGVQTVNFQTPCEVPPGTANVVVTVSGSSTTIPGVTIFPALPGIFNYQGADGKPYAAVISASNGAYVTSSNPAVRGQTYYVVVTGLGEVSPSTSTDSAGIAGQNVNLQVLVGVNNVGVPVLSSQYSVNSIGVYVVGFTIPTSSSPGTDQPLAVAVVVNGTPVFGNLTYLPQVN